MAAHQRRMLGVRQIATSLPSLPSCAQRMSQMAPHRHYVNQTAHPDFDPLKRRDSVLSAAFYDQMVVLVSAHQLSSGTLQCTYQAQVFVTGIVLLRGTEQHIGTHGTPV